MARSAALPIGECSPVFLGDGWCWCGSRVEGFHSAVQQGALKLMRGLFRVVAGFGRRNVVALLADAASDVCANIVILCVDFT